MGWGAPPPWRCSSPRRQVCSRGWSGTIVDETTNPVDVAATIIDLAVRGHLPPEGDRSGLFGRQPTGRLARTAGSSAPTTGLPPYERRLLDGIFGSGDGVALSELSNPFATTLKASEPPMYDEVVQRGWFRSSPRAPARGV